MRFMAFMAQKKRDPRAPLYRRRLLNDGYGDMLTLIGAHIFGIVGVNGNGAVLYGGEQGVVLVNGPVLERPGLGGEANGVIGYAQGYVLTADLGPLILVELADSPYDGVGEALH